RWVLRLRGRLRLRRLRLGRLRLGRLRLGRLRLGRLRSVGFGGGFFDEGEEGGEVVGAGVGVEQGGFEPEAAVEAGAAEDGAALVEEFSAYGGDGVVGGVCGPEQDRADGGVVVELEARMVDDEGGELRGPVADLVDEC